MVGPRTFSTGDPLYRGDGARQNDLSSYEETRHAIRRLKSWGAERVNALQGQEEKITFSLPKSLQ